MGSIEVGSTDLWPVLAVYRQRYDIEDRLGPLLGLERAVARRKVRQGALRRRSEELRGLLAECDAELAVLDDEIAGTNEVGSLLISEILDQVRIENDERWSPTPIRGYRMWRIEGNAMLGSQQVPWTTPRSEARCLRRVPGDDLPHAGSECGPPGCGIYATKELGMFPSRVVETVWDGYAIGVVALSGKVVEHEHGYRGAVASVFGIAARLGGLWLSSDRPADIEALFVDPAAAMAGLGSAGFPPPGRTETDLRKWKDKEQLWT